MTRKLSAGAAIWQDRMNRPFVVRGTVANVSNELVGTFATLQDARDAASKVSDGKIFHRISGAVVTVENACSLADSPDGQKSL